MGKLERQFAANPDLDIFSSPLLQTSIKGEQIIDCFPIAPLNHGQSIQFDIPASYVQMTDPMFKLYVQTKITQPDGKALAVV